MSNSSVPKVDLKINILELLRQFRDKDLTMQETSDDIFKELHRYEGRMIAESMENTPNND